MLSCWLHSHPAAKRALTCILILQIMAELLEWFDSTDCQVSGQFPNSTMAAVVSEIKLA